MRTTKSDEVPVLSTVSDPTNDPPPPYQLTRTIHHSPKSHLVSRLVVQILFGFIQFVLGLMFNESLTLWPLAKINFPYWLGGLLFMVVGVMSVVATKFPRPHWITLNVLLNLAGVVFAFTSIGLYSIYITGDFWWSCGRTDSLPTLVRGITYMLMGLSSMQIPHAAMVIITGLRILWRALTAQNNTNPSISRKSPLLLKNLRLSLCYQSQIRVNT